MSLLIIFIVFCVYFTASVNTDQPVVYFPPFELRAVSGQNVQSMFVPMPDSGMQESMQDPARQRMLHTTLHRADPAAVNMNRIPPAPAPEKVPEARNTSINVHELLHALGITEEEHEQEGEHSRAAARDYDYSSYQPYPRPPSYGYPKPGYPPYGGPSLAGLGSWPPPPPPPPPPQYHDPTYAYVPPTVAHTAAARVKPLEKLDIVKPIASKVATKVSGIISLVLALLTGSAPNGSELNGFKDLVINGIVKPLLVAKGGLKSLISKLTIPVISLLLINLEVLITIWWLWEDCPEPVHAPAYSYPKPAYNYNSYR